MSFSGLPRHPPGRAACEHCGAAGRRLWGRTVRGPLGPAVRFLCGDCWDLPDEDLRRPPLGGLLWPLAFLFYLAALALGWLLLTSYLRR